MERSNPTNSDAPLFGALLSLEGLSEIDTVIRSKLESRAPVITEISNYLLDLGGKRIRPILTLLSAQSVANAPGKRISQLYDVAAGIELIHMATLLHDDIIDKAPLRRHKPSPFVRFGADATLLTGDFLLVRAFGLCARLDPAIIDWTEEACVALTEGEILETSLASTPHSIESSIEIARKKTAALFRLAARCGSHLAGATAEAVEKFAMFGEALGIAFQILDDILDVTSTAEQLGKRRGQDIFERKPSIVNVLWLQSGSPLAQALRDGGVELSEPYVHAALKEILEGDVIVQARAMARDYAERAHEHFCSACLAAHASPNSVAAELVAGLIRYVLDRTR